MCFRANFIWCDKLMCSFPIGGHKILGLCQDPIEVILKKKMLTDNKNIKCNYIYIPVFLDNKKKSVQMVIQNKNQYTKLSSMVLLHYL
jgi:carbonic anhydrase